MPGHLDDDRQLVRLVRVVAVDVRPEAAPQPGEARHLPELGEELLDLGLEALRLAACRGVPRPLKLLAVGTLGRVARVDAIRAAASQALSSSSGSSSSWRAGSRARSSRRILSNTFSVPGPSPSRCATTLEQHFGDRSDGSFTVVFALSPAQEPRSRREVRAGARRRGAARGARWCRTARSASSTSRRRRRHTVVYGDVRSTLRARRGEGLHRRRARARSDGRRAWRTCTSRAPAAIQHDLDPVFQHDLRHGRADDRAADRAPRPARRVRPLLGGHDPAHLRRLHDHGHARDRLRRRRASGRPRPTPRTSCS